jgi:hypothetical protein
MDAGWPPALAGAMLSPRIFDLAQMPTAAMA